MEVFWIRHGICRSNLERRYLGRTDEGLCPQGEQALRKRAAAGLYPRAEALAVSPMRRCLESAALLYPGQSPIVVPEFRECDFGCFEGKTHLELEADPAYQPWVDSGGTLPFPEGESEEALERRCLEGWRRLLERLSEKDGALPASLACVVHGGTLMALLSRLALPHRAYFQWQADNGDGYACRYDPQTGHLTDVRALVPAPREEAR